MCYKTIRFFYNDLDTLESTVSNKANTNHTHTTSQVSGLGTQVTFSLSGTTLTITPK